MKFLQHLRELVPDIDDEEPANVGNDNESHWTLQSHVVNLMERTKRLALGINKDMPPFLIKKEIELIEERLSTLKEYYNE